MNEIKTAKVECKQVGCTASTDGKCLEGLDIKSCPHCSIIEEQNIDETIVNTIPQSNTIISNEELFIDVHSGDVMDLNETIVVTSSSLTRLLILAGLPDYGKTTLLASLFELFQRNKSFANYCFSGSRTLIGFEKICHLSRIASERETADTYRTTNIVPKFLHISVKKEDTDVNILFTDISGEYFRDYLSVSSEECKRFEVAKRADHFVLFIDSDLLSNINERQNAKTSSLNILRSLTDTEMLHPSTYIQVLFSKWDLLLDKQDNEDHIKFIETVKDEILRKYSKYFTHISFHNIASRPSHPNNLQFGYGIDELLQIWVEKSPFIKNIILDQYPESFKSQREFSKYKLL